MNEMFDASEVLERLGVEDKLNAFLDSESVQEVIMAEYETVKVDLTAAAERLPEKYRGRVAALAEAKLHIMDGETFVECVLGKLSEDIAYSLHTLEKYLNITAVTQQLLDAVEEKTGLKNTLHEMACELAGALKRNIKIEMIKEVSKDCKNQDEFEQAMRDIFEGDECAMTVIVAEGVEDAAATLATMLAEYILGK